MSDPPSQFLTPKRLLVAAGIGLSILAVIYFGTESQPPVEIAGPAEGDVKQSCETRLASALDKARPESLGLIGTDAALRVTPADAAAAFSDWLGRSDCRDASATEPLAGEGRDLVEKLLGRGGADRLSAERFGPFDAAHVRDALIDFAAAQSIAKPAGDDLGRVLRVFEYVSRTVSPQGESTVAVPLTTYEAHLFGAGPAEDRALLFANLLRQLRVDAVVLRPAGEDGGPWWIGVLQKDGVYLFDAELGLPVPAPDAPPPAAPAFLPKPATWAQAVANPELLAAYRREAGLPSDPIPTDRLKSPQVELIGPASFWKTAMERLELSLPGERGVLLYDPLQDTSAGPGLYRRVADAGLSEAIAIWPYPASLEEARSKLSQAQRDRLEQRISPFLGPVQPDPRTQIPGPQKKLWETRVAQMSGRTEAAIPSYLLIRSETGAERRRARSEEIELSPADEALNRRAADEADYWIAQGQFDLGQYTASGRTARRYVERGGSRADEAAALVALSLAAEGNTAEAAEEIAKLPETAPAAPRLRWLAGRWKAASANPQAAAEASAETSAVPK